MKPDVCRCSIIRLAGLAFLILAAGGCVASPRTHFQSVQSAAERGNARAEYELAQCYARGSGVRQDYVKAVAYLRQSAEQGYADAQTSLGSCYARGLGVKSDFSEALQWYRKAAAQGDSLAEYCLGYAYAHGNGVPKDFKAAVQWWQKSAGHGQVYAQNALGQFYFREAGSSNSARVKYAEAAKWLRKAAKQGCVGAMNNLAFLYQNGWGVNKNLPRAVKWYRQAALKGDAMAQANLGLMYQDGDGGLPHDKVQAYKWFMLSAEQGNIVGRHSFDEYNEKHLLTPEQFTEARRMAAKFHGLTNQNERK